MLTAEIVKQQLDKNLKLKFSMLQATFWCSWCTFTSFAALYFAQKGMLPSQIGFALSACTFCGILGQMAWGTLCDFKGTLKKVFIWANVMIWTVTLLFYFVNRGWSVVLLMGVMGFAQAPQPSILDTWIFKKLGGNGKDYGFIRAWASLGFAGFAFFYGQILDVLGFGFMFVFASVFFLFTILVSAYTGDAILEEAKVPFPKIGIKDRFPRLFQNKGYVFILIVSFIINLGSQSAFILLPLIISSVGGTPTHLGIALFFAVIMEVPTLMASRFISSRLPTKVRLLFSVAIYIGQFSLLAFAKTPEAVIAAMALQGFAFGNYLPSIRQYVFSKAPEDLQTTAQTLFDGVNTGITGVIGGAIGGMVIQMYGVPILLSVFVGLEVMAFMILLLNMLVARERFLT